jgi:hypothetical protein
MRRTAARRSSVVWQRSRILALLGVALFLGCHADESVRLVRLEITGDGSYLLEGEAVAQGSLGTALVRLRRPGEKLAANLTAPNGAGPEAVAVAISEAKGVGVVVAMVGNEVFYAASQPSQPRR